eukprot:15773637-Heterocapsa_arctica.AAC.1
MQKICGQFVSGKGSPRDDLDSRYLYVRVHTWVNMKILQVYRRLCQRGKHRGGLTVQLTA